MEFVNRLFRCTGLLLGVFGIYACSSGSPDQSAAVVPQTTEQTRISGRVFDAVNGQPIQFAIIRTDPPTEEVSTGSDGTFQLSDSINGAGTYQVMVEHTSYESAQTTVSVAANSTTTVDFALHSSAIGLHASANTIQFSVDMTRETLRLSSNIEQTGFSILTPDPWVSVSPRQGVIANRETATIEIILDRNKMPVGESANSEIIINADNGTRELVITLLIESATEFDYTHEKQHDCRQTNVLQFGYDDPNYPLIQFPESLVLPQGAGNRGFETINPFLIDSFILTELGTVTLTHVSGGPDDSSLEIFELNLEDKIATIAINTGVSEENKRAAIKWALIPGVYCYYLGGTEENFEPPTRLNLMFEFTPAP